MQHDDDSPVGFTAARVIAGGRQRRRARTTAFSGVALVAAGAGAVVPAALVDGAHSRGGVLSASPGAVAPTPMSSSVPSSSAAGALPSTPVPSSSSLPSSSQQTPASSSSSSPAPTVRVVQPGTVDLGGGYSLKLTKDSVIFAGDGGQVGPLYTDNGNQGPGSIGLQTSGRLVGGLYIGGGTVASGKVTVDGKVYATSVVMLSGNPGWAVAYVMLPTLPPMVSGLTIAVYDATGHQLAALDPPPTS